MTDSAESPRLRFAPGVGLLVDPERWCSHYTSVETFLEYILPSNSLRLSPLPVVNDSKESGISGWMGGSTPFPPEKVQAFVAMESEVDRLVFTKHRDWASEAELRFACYSQDVGHHYLQLADAVAALILGPEFPDTYRSIVEAEARRRDVPALKLQWNASSAAYERWA